MMTVANDSSSSSRSSSVVRFDSLVRLAAALLAAGLFASCTSSSSNEPDLPKGIADLPFLQDDWAEAHGGAKPGNLKEVEREKRTGIDTEKLDLLPQVKEDDDAEDLSQEDIPSLGGLPRQVSFEFFDIGSNRFFRYTVDRAELAKASRSISRLPNEHQLKGERPTKADLDSENAIVKSWSNATDNRIRRAIADGYSDTHSIYRRLADYGGCSATVLSANNSRMVAITAAHCVFTAGNNFSTSKIRPRRNGSTSPTWGSWTAYAFGYYPQFPDGNCEDNFRSACIKHDIALVLATPDSGATPPSGMGWGYRPKSFLDSHSKYRRGYPGCSNPHSPASCTANNLYGDGGLSVGSFSKKDSDNWNRQIRFSSDVNPGDSGSGLYYYRDGFPYVFAVTSAEPSSCKTGCTSSRPNYARRITPQFYDFINSVVP
jgi:hypothetical protein